MDDIRWRTPLTILNSVGLFETYVGETGPDSPEDRWIGRVWLNLPYGPFQRAYMTHMANHHHGIAFLGARPDTTLFQRYVFGHATAVLFLEGRIALIDDSGQPDKASAAPRALAAYGEDDAIVLRRSGLKGTFLWTEAAKRTGERTLA
jgi:hypothetical protein